MSEIANRKVSDVQRLYLSVNYNYFRDTVRNCVLFLPCTELPPEKNPANIFANFFQDN